MKIEIVDGDLRLLERFVILAKTDLKCPQCGKDGMIVKYRCNGKIGFFHETSGILLACENWGKCKSVWNDGTGEVNFPWHTWIDSFHKVLDIQRGSYGYNFLNKLKEINKKLYEKILIIDKKIEQNTRK